MISGAVIQRHQVKAQEAALKDRANMQIYGGMGQGLGNLAGSFAQRRNELADVATNFAQQQALLGQRGQQAMDFENQRAANDQLEQATRVWDAIQFGGGRGGASMQLPAMPGGIPADIGIGTNIDGTVMQPQQATPPMQGAVPMPAIDPATTATYRDAEVKRDELIRQGQRIMMSSKPPAEKAAMLREITPQLYQTGQILQQYPRQKPPTTFQEMAQAGVHGGGITIAPDGSWLVPKGITRAMPPKTQPDVVPIPQTPEEAQQYAASRYATLDDGTKVLIQPDGKLTPVKDGADKKESGGLLLGDIGKEYKDAAKDLTSKDANDKVVTPPIGEVVAEVKKREQGVKQALVELKGLQPMVDELGDLLRKSQSLAQKGESDIAIEQRIAFLKKQLDEAMTE